LNKEDISPCKLKINGLHMTAFLPNIVGLLSYL